VRGLPNAEISGSVPQREAQRVYHVRAAGLGRWYSCLRWFRRAGPIPPWSLALWTKTNGTQQFGVSIRNLASFVKCPTRRQCFCQRSE
jgi:hypothetical protein